jgi:hypothetical protein
MLGVKLAILHCACVVQVPLLWILEEDANILLHDTKSLVFVTQTELFTAL